MQRCRWLRDEKLAKMTKKSAKIIWSSIFFQHIKYVTRIVKGFCVNCTTKYLRWLEAA